LHGAAVFRRGVQLQVVGVHVRRTAVEPDQNDGGVAGGTVAGRSLGAPAQEIGQGQPSGAEDAGLQKAAPRKAVAVAPAVVAENGEHGSPLGYRANSWRNSAACQAAAPNQVYAGRWEFARRIE